MFRKAFLWESKFWIFQIFVIQGLFLWRSYLPTSFLSFGMSAIRSCVRFSRCWFCAESVKHDLHTILCRQIRSAGPITVAEYMKIAMHHPIHVSNHINQWFTKFAGVLQKFFSIGTWWWLCHFSRDSSDVWGGNSFSNMFKIRFLEFGLSVNGWSTAKTHLSI